MMFQGKSIQQIEALIAEAARLGRGTPRAPYITRARMQAAPLKPVTPQVLKSAAAAIGAALPVPKIYSHDAHLRTISNSGQKCLYVRANMASILAEREAMVEDDSRKPKPANPTPAKAQRPERPESPDHFQKHL